MMNKINFLKKTAVATALFFGFASFSLVLAETNMSVVSTVPGVSVTLAAPEMTGNLSIPTYQAHSVALAWTVSSVQYDNDTLYDIRYSKEKITDANFAQATQYTGALIPVDMLTKRVATERAEIVSGLDQNVTYYFALKSKYKNSAWSGLSDVPSFMIKTDTPNTGEVVTANLSLGQSSEQVAKLQMFLATQGYYMGPVNKRFGPLTKAAVIKFQNAHGVAATGYVGAMTRAAMQKTVTTGLSIGSSN